MLNGTYLSYLFLHVMVIGGLDYAETARRTSTSSQIHSTPASRNIRTNVQECMDDFCPRSCKRCVRTVNNLILVFCTKDPFNELPRFLENNINAEILEIDLCPKLTRLPTMLLNMTHLRQIFLNDIGTPTIPHIVFRLKNLNGLSFSSKMREIPEEITMLTNLRVLQLDDNKLKVLSHIGRLSNLQTLSVRNNSLNALPDEIGHLTQLTELFISRNNFTTVPCKYVENLDYLDLSYNTLKMFPCKLVSSKLKTLRLTRTGLEEIPCSLTLKSAEKVYLDFNAITIIPRNSCSLIGSGGVKRISLAHNKIQTLPLTAFCLGNIYNSRLEQLILTHNLIKTIHIDSTHFPICFKQLSVLDLSFNRLTTLGQWPLTIPIVNHLYFTLKVDNNSLSQFSGTESPFVREGDLRVFSMRNNDIQHFIDIFTGWKFDYRFLAEIDFDFDHNPFNCDCIDYEIYKFMKTDKKQRYQKLKCRQPPILSGKNLLNVPLIEFVCKEQNGCPIGCVCYNVPFLKTINVTCNDDTKRDLPARLPRLKNSEYMYSINISHQNLSMLTYRPYIINSSVILLGDNLISNLPLNFSQSLENVRKLHLDRNLLQRLPESILNLTSLSLEEIRLGDNSWVCDCGMMPFKTWILSNKHIVKDWLSVRCKTPKGLAGVRIVNLSRSELCPTSSTVVIYVVVTAVVLLLLFLVGVASKTSLKKWHLMGLDECDGEGKEFDVFLSYATEDEEYVEGYLIPELEKRDFRVCFHRVHFHGGKPIHVNMSEAIEKSKRTLVFFSNDFVESNFGMYEFRLAHHLDIENKTRRLITILDEDLDTSQLDVTELHYFATHTYVRREDPNFWRNLLYTLPRKRLGAEVY